MAAEKKELQEQFEYVKDKDGNATGVIVPIEDFENIMACLGGFHQAIIALKEANPSLAGIEDEDIREIIESVEEYDEEDDNNAE